MFFEPKPINKDAPNGGREDYSDFYLDNDRIVELAKKP